MNKRNVAAVMLAIFVLNVGGTWQTEQVHAGEFAEAMSAPLAGSTTLELASDAVSRHDESQIRMAVVSAKEVRIRGVFMRCDTELIALPASVQAMTEFSDCLADNLQMSFHASYAKVSIEQAEFLLAYAAADLQAVQSGLFSGRVEGQLLSHAWTCIADAAREIENAEYEISLAEPLEATVTCDLALLKNYGYDDPAIIY